MQLQLIGCCFARSLFTNRSKPFVNVMQVRYGQFDKKKRERKQLAQALLLNMEKKQKLQMALIKNNMTIRGLAAEISVPEEKVVEIARQIGFLDEVKSWSKIELPLNVAQSIAGALRVRYRVKTIAEPDENPREESVLTPSLQTVDPSSLGPRPPVVTIMGHVDHGKTTLLDSLRQTRVVDQEFGGITQHIGAFSVELADVGRITFLDTPGHAAFSAMRSRGAQVTDLVVLVVAADDGVMQQTRESIRFAQQAGVPIIVAINKIDKSNANLEMTKRSLLEAGIQTEDMGGTVQCIPISALKNLNLDKLLEAILAEAEILEIRGNPTGETHGVIIESQKEEGKGRVATMLVQGGTLRRGQILLAGNSWARVRDICSDAGQSLSDAGPSTPVKLTGWRMLPNAGDFVVQVASERRAAEVVRERQKHQNAEKARSDMEAYRDKNREIRKFYETKRIDYLKEGRTRQAIFASLKDARPVNESVLPGLSIILKGDVHGSVDALVSVLASYPNKQCELHIMAYDVGPVTETDIRNLEPFSGIVYSFNVDYLNDQVKRLAEKSGVRVKRFNIIYELVDDLKLELRERVTPEGKDEVVAEATVLQVFTLKKKGTEFIAGCRCTSGILQKNKIFQLVRDDQVIHKGPLESLRHIKTEVESIQTGVECGIKFEDKRVEIQSGDVIQCMDTVYERPPLEWSLHF